ncbi:hypothetical protein MBLNU230_g8270t1 [Neophaeotheca triangularis]
MSPDAIQSFLSSYEQSSDSNNSGSIPAQQVACCCGNTACAHLQHNQSALEGLERDVRTAAKLGQALLVRHETYMADAEKERQTMTEHIEKLEGEKKQLETKNATVIEENRNLLDQLEAVNNAVSDSEAHVTGLQATLSETQRELQKLSHLAHRTEELERQLAEYEREEASWHDTLTAKEEGEKSALKRWRESERTLARLQEEMDRIEREAREERERHVEVVGRMERRHAVEQELHTAASRLKGAAASKTVAKDSGGTNVVSHFVKDILQDNANLQMGIVELREMLHNSNDEVETLREKLSMHQPQHDDVETDERPGLGRRTSSLKQELDAAAAQELHVHHHYHASTAANNASTLRKPRKKRYGALTPGHFTPPSGRSLPRTSVQGTPSSVATILKQTAVSVPRPAPLDKRWSSQSDQTYHSMLAPSGPSSPLSSLNRTSSLFDRVFSDAGHEDDSSRPTTPETEEPASPCMLPASSKRMPANGFRTISAPIVPRVSRGFSPGPGKASLDSIMDTSTEEMPALHRTSTTHDSIVEESESDWENAESSAQGSDPGLETLENKNDTLDLDSLDLYNQPLRRATSHDSLFSVRGMDIHTVKARPSQFLGSHGNRSLSTQAVLTDTTAHATRPTALSRPSDGSSRHILRGMAAEQRQRANGGGGQTLGKKVGGWVFGRWGATPAPAQATSTSATLKDASKGKLPTSDKDSVKGKTSAEDPQTTPKKPKVRAPGINQSGPILGLAPEVKIVRPPVLKSLDESGLQEVLGKE